MNVKIIAFFSKNGVRNFKNQAGFFRVFCIVDSVYEKVYLRVINMFCGSSNQYETYIPKE